MTPLPRLLGEGRVTDAVRLPVLAVGQAAALGIGAFATRDAFAALHGGAVPGPGVLGALVAAGVAAGGVELLARRRGEALGQHYARALRQALYGHVAGMDRRTLAARRLGGLSLRFVGDLTAARLWFGRGLPRLIAGAVVLPAAALVLWLLDPRLMLAAGVPLALSLAGMAALAVGMQGLQTRLRGRRAALSVAAMERLAMAADLDLLARTDRELQAMEAEGAEVEAVAVARATRVGLVRLVPQAGAAVGAAAVLWTAGAGGIAPATAAAGLSVLAILVLPLREFAPAWDAYCGWAAARDRARALLALPSRRRDVLPRGHAVALALDHLAVGTATVSAEVPAGGVLAIVGPPGSGKSQLAGIIAGLDRAAGGRVLYDGAEAPLPRIAALTDRPAILQGSLRRALTLGIDPRPPATEVRRVARAFGLSALVNHGGLTDFRVGEAGRTVSAGEMLRIGLARIALARPDLVVLDSPALSADPEAPALVARLRTEAAATLVVAGVAGIAAPDAPLPDATVRLERRTVSRPAPTSDWSDP
jgi:ABC-type multidrug transport system fused ATPase/permease subunit